MDVALMHDRPALKEVVGVLVVCALALAVLATLDNRAAHEYQARAQKVIAAREAVRAPAARPAPVANPLGPAWTGRTRAAAPADRGSVLPAAMLAAGLAMAAAGAVLLSRRPSA